MKGKVVYALIAKKKGEQRYITSWKKWKATILSLGVKEVKLTSTIVKCCVRSIIA